MSKSKRLLNDIAKARMEEQHLQEDITHELHKLKDSAFLSQKPIRSSVITSRSLKDDTPSKDKDIQDTKEDYDDLIVIKKRARELTKKGYTFK